MINKMVKGELIRTSIMGKTKNGMLISVNIKKLRNALFHTANGEAVVTVNVACIQVDSNQGRLEYIAGNFAEARALARRIINENIHFVDIGTFIELEMCYRTLNNLVEEAKLRKSKNITINPKDIETTTEIFI